MRIKKMTSIAIIYALSFFSNAQESQQMVNPNIFGFCTSNTFTFFDVDDTSFTNIVSDMRPQVLRFPGGSLGNFYHINGSGYGFNIEEIDNWDSQKFSKRARGLSKISNRKEHSKNYIEDFIELVKLIDAKVILVANILTANENDIIDMIHRFRSEKIDILGIELGNELSNRSYEKHITSVLDYITLAENTSHKIKSHFPQMKIGVVACPIKRNMPTRLMNWNIDLSKKDFYDAIIYHSYIKILDGESEDGLMTSEYMTNQNKKSQFDLYAERAISSISNDFFSDIHYYNNIFNNKEIWITEWNLQMSKITGNTLLQSLFVTQYLLEMLSNSKLQNIKIATYHNLAGRDISGSVFKEDKDHFEIHSTFIPFSLISVLFKKKIFSIKKEDADQKGVYIYNCYDVNDDIQMTYIVNWSDEDFYYSNKKDLNVVYSFYSNDLYDKPNSKGDFLSESYILDTDPNLTINKYSVSLFHQ